MSASATRELARSLYRGFGDRFEAHRRSAMKLPRLGMGSSKPTVYFLTPDYDVPAGGVQVIYRHVDILNAEGFSAFVLHQRRGFRCSWFRNSTRVTDVGSIRIGSTDLLVVPEVDIDLLDRLPPDISYVIFNQNSHFTWRRGSELVSARYISHRKMRAILSVSDHNAKFLKYTFPSADVRRIHLSINATLFAPSDLERKPIIAYMTRRGSADAAQVLAILNARGLLGGWDIVPLDNLRHEDVAARLRESTIFLAFAYQEGFGLPAAEAMACGNYVVGFHGFGGKEFFDPDFCAPIETGDILGFVSAVETALRHEANRPGWCREQGLRASRCVLERYSLERERADVLETYSDLMCTAVANRAAQ